MLLVCDIPRCVRPNTVILNLSTYFEGVEKLNLLPPTNDNIIPFKDEKEFDIAYANYIMSNDYTFMELMKIIIPLYEGNDVCILVSKSPYYDMITESLTKFIQVRYSYNTQVINTLEDLNYLDLDSTFNTLQGIYNLDQDKERFSRLIAPSLMVNGEIKYGK